MQKFYGAFPRESTVRAEPQERKLSKDMVK